MRRQRRSTGCRQRSATSTSIDDRSDPRSAGRVERRPRSGAARHWPTEQGRTRSSTVLRLNLLVGRADDPRPGRRGRRSRPRPSRRAGQRPSGLGERVRPSGRPSRTNDQANVHARESSAEFLARGSIRGVGHRARPRLRIDRPRDSSPRPDELHAQVRVDEAVEAAVEHGAGVADLVVGPQVLDELVGLEDVRADLAAEADLALLVVLLGEVGLALLLLAGGSAWP